MSKKSSITVKGTRIKIDGDEWTVILTPFESNSVSPKVSQQTPVDAETIWRGLCGLNLVAATRQADGEYSFSVPPSLANQLRSKIASDFVWEKIEIQLV